MFVEFINVTTESNTHDIVPKCDVWGEGFVWTVSVCERFTGLVLES